MVTRDVVQRHIAALCGRGAVPELVSALRTQTLINDHGELRPMTERDRVAAALCFVMEYSSRPHAEVIRALLTYSGVQGCVRLGRCFGGAQRCLYWEYRAKGGPRRLRTIIYLHGVLWAARNPVAAAVWLEAERWTDLRLGWITACVHGQ